MFKKARLALVAAQIYVSDLQLHRRLKRKRNFEFATCSSQGKRFRGKSALYMAFKNFNPC